MATLPGARRAAWRPLGALVVASFVLASCGGDSGYQYFKSQDNQAYFKVPSDWTRFNKRDLLVASGQSLSAATERTFPWLIGFDAAPDPSLDNILSLAAPTDHPTVYAQQEVLTFGDHDMASQQLLRNKFYPVDELLDQDVVDLLAYEELVLPGGFHGLHLVYDVSLSGVDRITSGGAVIRVNQTSVLDAGEERLYLLIVRCETHCYRDNAKAIDQIVDSWTVKER